MCCFCLHACVGVEQIHVIWVIDILPPAETWSQRLMEMRFKIRPFFSLCPASPGVWQTSSHAHSNSSPSSAPSRGQWHSIGYLYSVASIGSHNMYSSQRWTGMWMEFSHSLRNAYSCLHWPFILKFSSKLNFIYLANVTYCSFTGAKLSLLDLDRPGSLETEEQWQALVSSSFWLQVLRQVTGTIQNREGGEKLLFRVEVTRAHHTPVARFRLSDAYISANLQWLNEWADWIHWQ